MVIAGEGPLELELKKLVIAENFSNIEFVGRITDAEKIACFDLCKAVVFPSFERSEAFGVTLLEGSMRSKPLITADIGSGTSYVNVHMDTGLVVEPNDCNSLLEALLKLDSNDELVEVLGAGARRRYEKLFTSSVMARKYRDHYQELIEMAQ